MKYGKDIEKAQYNLNRREFLRTTSRGLGSLALGGLILPDLLAAPKLVNANRPIANGGRGDVGPTSYTQGKKGHLPISERRAKSI